MSKKSKRVSILVSLMLVVTMLLGTSSVWAEESKVNYKSDSIITKEAEGFLKAYFSESEKTFNPQATYKLGKSIPSYIINETKLEKCEKQVYYPVYENNNVIGIFTIHAADEEFPTYSFGEEFASDINKYIKDNTNFCLLMDNSGLYIKTKENITLVRDYSFVDKSTNYIRGLNDVGVNLINASQYDVNNQFYIPQSFINELNVGYIRKGNNKSISASLTDQPKTKTLPVVTWDQGDTGNCWAATVSCIGFYLKKTKWVDPHQIAREMGLPNGAYNEDSIRAFQRYYSVTAVESSVPSNEMIMSKIDYLKPIYLDYQSKDFAHAMTLRGYYYDTTTKQFKISVMDSVGGQYIWYQKTGGGYSYTRDNQTYKLFDVLLV